MRTTRGLAAAILVGLGLLRADAADKDVKNDAGETATFQRKLEYVMSEVLRVEYAEIRFRDLLPIDTQVPPGAQAFTWRIMDWRGAARVLSDFADDLPTVEIMGAEKSQILKTCGIGYFYSLQDIESANFGGINLDTEKASAARRAHENLFENLAAFGDAANDLPGFLNNANVPIISAPGDITGDWLNPSTDPLDILADLHKIVNTIRSNTKGIRSPDTMVFSTAIFDHLSVRRISIYDKTSILQAFVDASPYVKSVDQWNRLDTADAAGTGPRVVCYKRDKGRVSFVLPRDFTQRAPQVKNLGFSVPCDSRVGGVLIKDPIGMAYVDGMTS